MKLNNASQKYIKFTEQEPSQISRTDAYNMVCNSAKPVYYVCVCLCVCNSLTDWDKTPCQYLRLR